MSNQVKCEAEVTVAPGSSTNHRGVTISRDIGGDLRVGERTDARCVEFNVRGRGSSSFHCMAVLVGNSVKIFEGDPIGSGMLDREEVLAACR